MFKVGDKVRVKDTERAMAEGVPREQVLAEGTVTAVSASSYKLDDTWYYNEDNLELQNLGHQWLYCYVGLKENGKYYHGEVPFKSQNRNLILDDFMAFRESCKSAGPYVTIVTTNIIYLGEAQ